LAISLEAQGAEPASADARRAPNVLVILADDMGFSDIGCYGGEIATPNIDKLAANGLRFTQFYNTARCWPTRCSLLSGYYAQQLRMDPPKGPLPAWARLAPHYLSPAGYRCYHSGKWHVPGAPKVVAQGGFDRSYRIEDHDRFFDPKRHFEDDLALPLVPPGTDFYITSHIADRAIEQLTDHARQHADKPFFQYLAFIAPHFPLHALQQDIDKYRDRYLVGWDRIRDQRLARMKQMGIFAGSLSAPQPGIAPTWNLSEVELQRRIAPGEAGRAVPWDSLSDEQKRFQATKMAIHAAMIDRMDQDIGRVLRQIEAMGKTNDTIVLFASDNGASAEQIIRGDGHDPQLPAGSAGTFLCLGPGFSMAANTPLKLHKSYVHEGGISTPLVVCWPSGIKARGELRHTPGHVVDIVPTLLELANVAWTDTHNDVKAPPLAGRSLLPAFERDIPAPHEEPLFFAHDGHRALRVGDWKIVSLKPAGEWELYDLATDRGENHNVAGEHPDRVAAMAEQWTTLAELYREQAGPAPIAPAKRPAAAR
jgi:arylsulfatase